MPDIETLLAFRDFVDRELAVKGYTEEAEDLIGRKEAAQMAGRDPKTISRWIKKHGIGFMNPAGRWMIKRRDFRLFLMNRIFEFETS